MPRPRDARSAAAVGAPRDLRDDVVDLMMGALRVDDPKGPTHEKSASVGAPGEIGRYGLKQEALHKSRNGLQPLVFTTGRPMLPEAKRAHVACGHGVIKREVSALDTLQRELLRRCTGSDV